MDRAIASSRSYLHLAFLGHDPAIDDALRKLDQLTQNEHWMTGAEKLFELKRSAYILIDVERNTAET
jgi:hypothetical protein